MFTRKHYEMVASIIRNTRTDLPGPEVLHRVAMSFADEFAENNDRFDEARFLKACGVTA